MLDDQELSLGTARRGTSRQLANELAGSCGEWLQLCLLASSSSSSPLWLTWRNTPSKDVCCAFHVQIEDLIVVNSCDLARYNFAISKKLAVLCDCIVLASIYSCGIYWRRRW